MFKGWCECGWKAHGKYKTFDEAWHVVVQHINKNHIGNMRSGCREVK